MPPAGLGSLPQDLKDLLLRFVTFDGKISLARTSKEWHPQAIAAAYHSLRFRCDLDVDKSRSLAVALLAPENQGVAHIRHCTILPNHDEGDLGDSDPAMKAVLEVFSFLLPVNTLLSMTCESCHVLDPELTTVLHRRQQNLETLRLDGWRTSEDNCLSESLLKEGSLIDISHVKYVQLLITTKWQSDWFNIPELPALEHLEINADTASVLASDGQDPRDPTQHHRVSQYIIDDVFSADHFHARLTNLALRGLDLQDAGPLIKPVLHSQVLRTLTLQQCRNITTFVKYMADDEQLLPVLKCLNIANPADRPYFLDAPPLNALLTRLSGLVSILLSVTLVTSHQVAVRGLQSQALTQHAGTLQYAYLDLARHEPEAFVRQIRSCTKLRQLAIPNMGRLLPLAPAGKCEALGPIAKETLRVLKDLRSLYLLDDLQRVDHEGHLNSVVYPVFRTQRLFDITSYTFEGAPHLNIIGVGRRRKMHNPTYQRRHPDYFTQHPNRVHEVEPAAGSEPPKYFMRAERKDLDGRKTVMATEVHDLVRLQAVEPWSDIFDIVADSTRMLQNGSAR